MVCCIAAGMLLQSIGNWKHRCNGTTYSNRTFEMINFTFYSHFIIKNSTGTAQAVLVPVNVYFSMISFNEIKKKKQRKKEKKRRIRHTKLIMQ